MITKRRARVMIEPTGLKDIKDDQFHGSILENVCNSFSMGPVRIDYCVDLSRPSVFLKVFINDEPIGIALLTEQDRCSTIMGGRNGVRTAITLCLDPDKREVTYEIETCLILYHWGCSRVRGILYSWEASSSPPVLA
jgi:hypothetical protein